MIILTGQAKSTQTIYRYRAQGKFARMYMTAEGRAIKDGYVLETRSQWKNKPLKGDVGLEITFYHGDKRKRDLDNFLKLVLDAMNGIVFEDDVQIKEMTLRKEYDKKNPRVEVLVKDLEV